MRITLTIPTSGNAVAFNVTMDRERPYTQEGKYEGELDDEARILAFSQKLALQ